MKITDFLFLKYFKPYQLKRNLFDINLEQFKNEGIKLIICDLDNTLVPHFTKLPTQYSISFINKLKQEGFIFIVASNNISKRVIKFCEILKPHDFVYNAKKPLKKKVNLIIKKWNFLPHEILIIGDQFITDVWLANRLGIKSVLVTPLVNANNNIKDHFVNFIEKILYKKLLGELDSNSSAKPAGDNNEFRLL